jgi:hypothetical protein
MHEKSGKLGIQFWFLMTLGVIALIGLSAISIVRLLPGDEQTALPAPQPAFSLPGRATGPQAPVSLLPPASVPGTTPAPSTTPTETRSWETTAATPPRTTPPPVRATVTGRYTVLNSFGDSFIGEVLLTNTTGRAQDWRVVLVVPSNVGALRTSWLESLPQPTLSRNGRTYTWTSSVPLSARSTGQMRFHFDRTGGDKPPDSCTVNGSSCRS